jgi:hypothetical protein
MKTNEVNNLRYLARCILSQKSELDKFFLETIEYLKEAPLKETGFGSNTSLKRIGLSGKKIEYPTVRNKQISWGSESKILPPLFPRPTNTQNYTDENFEGNQKVDLGDLTNAEKQKIIRILYAKINRGVTPGYWKQIETMVKRREKEYMIEGQDDPE